MDSSNDWGTRVWVVREYDYESSETLAAFTNQVEAEGFKAERQAAENRRVSGSGQVPLAYTVEETELR